MIEAEIVALDGGKFLIVLDDHPDALGPFTPRELKALLRALLEWEGEEQDG